MLEECSGPERMYNKFSYLYICGGHLTHALPSPLYCGCVWTLCMPLFNDFVARHLVMVTGDTTLIKPVHMHTHPTDVEVAL
jgi:hypothetical protein